MGKDLIKLKSGKLEFLADPDNSKIELSWDGQKISGSCGFISIMESSRGERYYSDRALWNIQSVCVNEFKVSVEWPGEPFKQCWTVSLKDENTIIWHISLTCGEGIQVESLEAGTMLSPSYTKWFNLYEGGRFSVKAKKDGSWQDAKVKNAWLKLIGVKDPGWSVSRRPVLIFDFRDVKYQAEPEIRSSGLSATGPKGILALVNPVGIYPNEEEKEYDIFRGEIKLFTERNSLSVYLDQCRKTERNNLYHQAYLMNRDGIYTGVFNYLISRIKVHYYDKGLLYVFYRGAGYFYYCLKADNVGYILFNIFKKLKNKEDGENLKHWLGTGRLKLLVNTGRGSIDIFYDDMKLTKSLGFITAVGERLFLRHYSNQALWKTVHSTPDGISLNLRWPSFPIEQEWLIKIENDTVIKWDIAVIPKKDIFLAEKEAGIMLSSGYKMWLSSYEEGEFSEFLPGELKWEDIKIWNLSSKTIGVRGQKKNGQYKPGFIFKFEETEGIVEPRIRNSNCEGGLRVLLAQVKSAIPLKRYKTGKYYNIFSGRINIVEKEEVFTECIINYRKELYRERFPLNEEGMPEKYLLELLKPVEVVLVNLPWKHGDSWGVRAGSRWPHIKNKGEEGYLPFPFFLAYAASLLLESGVIVRVIDAIAEQIKDDDIINIINYLEPPLLIAEVSTPSLENDLRLLRQINKKNIKIAVCGPDFNIRIGNFLKENDFIDFVMFGEYEYTARELFDCIKNGKDLKSVAGLIYRQGNSIINNPSRGLIEDLDALPWPLREQLPMERYIDAPGNIPFPSVQMWASRGCPFKCIFCAWPQLMYGGNKYRMRRPETLVDEMEYLIKERKFKSIYFDDDTFNISRDSVLKICREIKERNLEAPWAIMARADTMDEEMLLKMRDAGLYAVKYGVESAEQKLLDNINKGMDLKKAERMIRFTNSLGIKTHLTFTFGLPGETKDTIKRTIDYAMSLDPGSIQFSITTPYPGTEYYRQLDAKGQIVSKDWRDYDGAGKSVIKTDYLEPADLEGARLEALRRWKQHKRSKRKLITMPFDQELRLAFRNSLKSSGLFHTLMKALRYVLKIDYKNN